MKLVLISDSHDQHAALHLPEGDVLIHAGDFSKRGTLEQVTDFVHWFAAQPHPHKIFIAGNHDFFCEQEPQRFSELVPDNCIYLNDSGTTLNNLNIWGSPIQPWFHDWAFNRQRGEEIRKHWDMIPDNTDILITHGPPFGIMDKLASGLVVGCEELLTAVQRVRPRIHLFGHIHEGYGVKEIDGTIFVNVAVLDHHYKMANDPIVLEL